MKSYFSLQIKRTKKLLPFVIAVTLVLFMGLSAILSGLIALYQNSEEHRKFTIAISGDTENEYLQWGIAAVQTLDETRFSIEFAEMPEEEAKEKMANGDISAYVVLSENFIENAINGKTEPLRFVTSAGADHFISLFKNEVAKLVTDMVVFSEKGVRGIGQAIRQNEITKSSSEHMELLSLEYVDLVFNRGKMISLEEIGITDDLSMTEYYLCGIAILFLMLMGLPFVTLHVRKDNALSRLLFSKGHSVSGQLLSEAAAHCLAMLTLLALPVLFVLILLPFFAPEADIQDLLEKAFSFSLRLVPVTVMITAFNLMLFEWSQGVVSGILIHFFTSLGLCYISGCFYPIYTFPDIIQRIALFLPTGAARSCLAAGLTGSGDLFSLLPVLGYALLFFGGALAARTYKTVRGQGV